MKSPASDSYALLIGVNDYTAYDPAKNLPGSVNDVAAWAHVCKALEIRPENVRVLVTGTQEAGGKMGPLPKDRFPEMLDGSVLPATRDNILAGLSWLAGKLAGGMTPGLLTYSGHGDFTSGGDLAICPTDVEKGPDGAVQNLVGFTEIRDIIARGGADTSLTVVLDCCHAGGAAQEGRQGLSLRDQSPPAGATRVHLGARELVACKISQIASQSQFTSQFHGAFTWALTALLLQWQTVREDGTVRLDVSYGTARQVAQTLLSALNYPDQTPQVYPPGIALLPFFHPGDVVTSGETSKAPDGARIGIQLDPNTANGFDLTLYTFTLHYMNGGTPGTTTGEVLSVGNTGDGYTAGTEYWSIANLATSWSKTTYTSKSLTVAAVSYDWAAGSHHFPGWTGTTATTPTRQSDMAGDWGTATSSPPLTTMWWGKSGLNLTATAVTWYYPGSDPPPGDYFLNPVNVSLATFLSGFRALTV